MIEAEIIIIDNASSDDSCAMVRKRFPEINFIANTENVGFSKANNQGVKIAKGEYVCILNPDTIVTENTFTDILARAEAMDSFGIMGVRLLDGTGNFLAESKRNIPTPKNSFSKMFGIPLSKEKGYYTWSIDEKGDGEVSILVGAFMFMKRAVYNEAKGFDEEYFMYGEDIDLSYKMLKKGLKNYYIGSLPILHYKGESTVRDRVYLERFYGAMQLFYKKHFSSNIFYDTFINLGIKLSSLTRSYQTNTHITQAVHEYYLVSDDDSLKLKIQKKVQKDIKIVTLDSLHKDITTNREIIFDNNQIDFSDILARMMDLKSDRTTFKIIPKGCNFAVGSNSSDCRGDVIIF